ncbi:hypothetical protein BH09BAC3_BH09BAC3_33800 [soil metagenome]
MGQIPVLVKNTNTGGAFFTNNISLHHSATKSPNAFHYTCKIWRSNIYSPQDIYKVQHGQDCYEYTLAFGSILILSKAEYL